VLFRSLD